MFAAGETQCPHCGAEAAVFGFRDYQQKLMHALAHPLADVRMRAIIALGLRGERGAAEALTDCALRAPKEVVEGLEIVRSLKAILAGTGDSAPLTRLAEAHPAHAVQLAAIHVLSRLV